MHGYSHEEHNEALTLFLASGERGRVVGRKLLIMRGSTFDPQASHLAEEDGAEQEDGVEEQQTQAQPAVQPPVVQVDAHHLKQRQR